MGLSFSVVVRSRFEAIAETARHYFGSSRNAGLSTGPDAVGAEKVVTGGKISLHASRAKALAKKIVGAHVMTRC